MTLAAASPFWRRFWPASLAGRTALVLILGLMAVQALGLTIHAFDRVELQRVSEARENSVRAFNLWRALVTIPPERRTALLAEAELPSTLVASYDPQPKASPDMRPIPPDMARLFRVDGPGPGMIQPPPRRYRAIETRAGELGPNTFVISMRFPDQGWLNLTFRHPHPRPWHSDTFLIAFIAMSVTAGLLIWWGVRRLTRPVADLAAAAVRLGRDVNAPALPETGPAEVATAAAAFNTMAANIRRFVDDRTQMLAAISHDLRTPITRLRLRAEFLDDDEQRAKMLADLAEMESMIASTLAFARDDAANEPAASVDIASLARTVLDEAADACPERADDITFEGPEHLVLRVRPVALKRALSNLVGNALKYGDAARLALERRGESVVMLLDDDGPGIPEESQERLFQPFQRIERSRNRETGGTGLGLTIARSILRAHGGEVTLHNRPEGGLRVAIRLPG